MAQQKYILNKGRILLGLVDYHRQIIKDHTDTVGGGLWEIKDDKLYLFGKSMDFGSPYIADVKKAVMPQYKFGGIEVYFTDRLSNELTEDIIKASVRVK